MNFFKNITKLTLGSFFAQLVGVISAPLISRLYSPEDFGIVGVLLAFTGIVSLTASFKYELAIVLEKNSKRLRHLINLNFILIFLVCVLLMIISFFADSIIPLLNLDEKLIEIFHYSILIVFFSALYNVYSNRFNREKKYNQIAYFQIIRKVVLVVFQILFGYIFASALGLVLGHVLSVLISVFFIIIFFGKRFPFLYKFDFGKIINQAKRYYKFPLYTFPQSLVNLFSAHLPVIVLQIFYTLEIVGFYFFSLKIVQIPAMFIGFSIRQVFYKEAIVLKNDKKKLLKLFNKLNFYLSLIIILPTMILFLYSGEIFSFVFGENWITAGHFSAWMMLWFGSNIIAGPSRSLFLVFEEQQKVFYIDILLLICRVGALIYLSANFLPIIVIKWISILSLFFNILVIIYFTLKLSSYKLEVIND